MRMLIIAAAFAAMPLVSSAAFADTGAKGPSSCYDPDGDGKCDAPAGAASEESGYRGETWRDRDGRMRCRRSDGTVGMIVGGGAGALVGREVDTRGERATGTIVGAVAGALVGRAVERGVRCQ